MRRGRLKRCATQLGARKANSILEAQTQLKGCADVERKCLRADVVALGASSRVSMTAALRDQLVHVVTTDMLEQHDADLGCSGLGPWCHHWVGYRARGVGSAVSCLARPLSTRVSCYLSKFISSCSSRLQPGCGEAVSGLACETHRTQSLVDPGCWQITRAHKHAALLLL